jgi:hypothetical protein
MKADALHPDSFSLGPADIIILQIVGDAQSLSASVSSSLQSCACCHLQMSHYSRVFDAYVGRYEFVTRMPVSIHREGDKLFVQAVGR